MSEDYASRGDLPEARHGTERGRRVHPRRAVRLLVAVAAVASGAGATAQDPLEIVWSVESVGGPAISFSPDGALLAAAARGIDMRRVTDGEVLRSISGALSAPLSVAFSPDSMQLAAGDGDGRVHLWNVRDGGLAWTRRAGGDVTSVAFAPDGALASWSSDETVIRLWAPADGEPLQALDGHHWSHHNVAFSPDGSLVASGGDFPDYLVKLLRRSDGSVARAMAGHTGRVRSVVFSSDGALLASAGDDATIKLWRVSDGTLLSDLAGHGETVWQLAAAPNATLLSGSYDGTLKLWRLPEGTLLKSYAPPDGVFCGLAFSPCGELFAVSTTEYVVVARSPVPAPAPFVERRLGPQTQVALVAQPPAGTGRYSVVDRPSWQPVAGISEGGRYDPESGEVIFGPIADDVPRVLTYWVVIPPGGAGVIEFAGSGTADGAVTPIVGDGSLPIWEFPPPPLWVELRWRPLSAGMVLQIWGDPATYSIEASSDLHQWGAIGTVISETGMAEFVDGEVSVRGHRFYRAVRSD